MRLKQILIAVAAAALCACSHSDQSKELSALDTAYKSGVITKDEYEAKRLAWSTQGAALEALDKAFQAGVLTKDEYEARKAKLTSKVTALAALEKAYRAGVFTKDEYLAKKSSILASDSTTSPSSDTASAELPQSAPILPVSTSAPASTPAPQQSYPAPTQPQAAASAQSAPQQKANPAAAPIQAPSSAPAGTYRMKQVAVIDAQGFDHPIPSATMLIPVDWQSQGGTQWNIKDKCNGIHTDFKVSGADGRGIEFFPQYKWAWADDPTFLKRQQAQDAQFGAHACDVMPPMSAADFLKNNVRRLRPQAQIVGIEPVPELLADAQKRAQQSEQSWARAGLPRRFRADVARARVKYSLNGQEVEEWILATVNVVMSNMPTYNMQRGGMVQSTSYDCTANMNAVRAPAGKLDANEKFFKLMISTVRANPEWIARVTKNAQQIQAIEQKGIADRARINAQASEDIRKIQQEGYENRQKSQDERSNDFANYIRGVEDYRNPETGQTVKLDSNYGNAWVNNKGEYLLSDQSSYNPNVGSTESWKPLQRVKQ